MVNRSNIKLVGNTTQGQNLGDGADVFKSKAGGNLLQFRTIAATGSSVQIFQTEDEILIYAEGGGSGTTYTFENGLTKTLTNVTLGGNLTENTVISGGTLSQDFSVLGVGDLKLGSVGGTYLCGLQAKTIETCAVYIDADGKLTTGVAGEGGGGITGATNGLSANTTTVVLGGNLTKHTCIIGGVSNFDLCLGTNACELGNVNVFVNDEFTVNSDNSTICSSSGNSIYVGNEGIMISGITCLLTTPTTGTCTDSALTWDSGTTAIRQLPIIEEWVSSPNNLEYLGQKYSYPSHSVFVSDIATCINIPNYKFVRNIDLKSQSATLLYTIPTGMKMFLNCAKLVMLNAITPSTGFAVSIGNNASLYTNLATTFCIDDALENDVHNIPVCACSIGINTGGNCCAQVYFNVSEVAQSGGNVCAHLFLDGFLY